MKMWAVTFIRLVHKKETQESAKRIGINAWIYTVSRFRDIKCNFAGKRLITKLREYSPQFIME